MKFNIGQARSHQEKWIHFGENWELFIYPIHKSALCLFKMSHVSWKPAYQVLMWRSGNVAANRQTGSLQLMQLEI